MYRKIILTALILAFISALLAAQNNTGTLGITFSGIRSNVGHIAIGLFGEEKSWPDSPAMELQFSKEKMSRSGKLKVEVKELPAGTYAIALLDDKNDNLEMNMFLGIPLEGFGFSNNPAIQLKEPPFDECSFEFDGTLGHIDIALKYIGKGHKNKKHQSR